MPPSSDDDASSLTAVEERFWREFGPEGVPSGALGRMSLADLVRLVLERNPMVKIVLKELHQRPRLPDPAAGEALIRAYREGRVNRWITATLLGCVRVDGGYEVAADILRSAQNLDEGSKAAGVMASQDPASACAVFLEVLLDETARSLPRRCVASALRAVATFASELVRRRLAFDKSIARAVRCAVEAGRIQAIDGERAISGRSS